MGSEFTKICKKAKAEEAKNAKKLNKKHRERYSCLDCEPASHFKTSKKGIFNTVSSLGIQIDWLLNAK